MKKIFTIISAIVLVGCMTLMLCACGAKDEDITTTRKPDATEKTTNSGMVTDESKKGDNGVIGDLITDASEGLSDIVTDLSEDASDIMNGR